MPKKKRTPQPLKIDIKGDGVEIHATFTNVSIGKALQPVIERVAAGQPTQEHDFDAVLRVIDIAPIAVLQSIVKIASAKIALYENPPTQNQPPTA